MLDFSTVVTLLCFFLKRFVFSSSVNLHWYHTVLVSLGTFPVLVSLAKRIRSFYLQFSPKLFVVNLDCQGDHYL